MSPQSNSFSADADSIDLLREVVPTSVRLGVDVALLPCCKPKGCLLGCIDPANLDYELVRMVCSSDKCQVSPYMHAECFEAYEEQVLSCLRGMSRARSWSEKQCKQNLWTKKGYDLISKFCACRCGHGNLRKDLNHIMPTETAGAVDLASGGGEKGRRRRKKSLSIGERSSRAATIPQNSRSSCNYKNNDSLSSDNGSGYMQPFAHRTDYSIFDRLVPRHLVNSYHIKMEDDGYAAGDDTRSFVLSSLAFHRCNEVTCVLCDDSMVVYDRYPLINGTFYLSPLLPKGSSLEVETKGDDPLYLSAICLMCLVGVNRVACCRCGAVWRGHQHQIGTMYSYDLFAATPCCQQRVQCKECRKPLLDVSKLTLSFTQLSSQTNCSNCGTKDYHFIKPVNDFQVTKKCLPAN